MGLGGSPILSNVTWNEDSFDIARLFKSEPDFALRLFLCHRLMRCEDPRNSSQHILCFKYDAYLAYDVFEIDDASYILKHLKHLNLDLDFVRNRLSMQKEFLQEQDEEQITDKTKFKILQIKELSMEFPGTPINWLEMINSQLFSDSQITEDDEILIQDISQLKRFADFLKQSDKR